MRLYAFSLIPGTPLTLFASGLILAGAIVLLVSGIHTWRLVKSLDADFLKRYWVILLALIDSFFIGYVISGLAILSGTVPVGTSHILFSGILFLGAIFVGLVVRVSSGTIRQFQETTYSRDFLSTIVNSINEALFIISPEGQIEQANNSLHKLIKDDSKEFDSPEGFLPDQSDPLSGAPIESILGDPPILSTETVAEDIENLPFKSQETRLESGSDGETPVLFSAVPLRQDGKLTGIVCTARDITDRKQFENELQRENERLDKFTSVVSHDLRNPLNIAAGRLELAQSDCDSKHLTAVEDAHERMATLIENLLSLARQGETVTDPEPIDLSAIADGCWANIETTGATLTINCDQTIQADKTRLKQVFENLFRNAVEHGGEDVSITIGDLETGFYIADTGAGIPEDAHDEIFEVGYSTAQGGAGYGLGIVKEIVEAHGWEIRVTDSDDGGARFEITDVKFVE